MKLHKPHLSPQIAAIMADEKRIIALLPFQPNSWVVKARSPYKSSYTSCCRNDVFGILPMGMGYGKSLCYACLHCLFNNLHQSVVTPLTAIMENKVSSISIYIIILLVSLYARSAMNLIIILYLHVYAQISA